MISTIRNRLERSARNWPGRRAYLAHNGRTSVSSASDVRRPLLLCSRICCKPFGHLDRRDCARVAVVAAAFGSRLLAHTCDLFADLELRHCCLLRHATLQPWLLCFARVHALHVDARARPAAEGDDEPLYAPRPLQHDPGARTKQQADEPGSNGGFHFARNKAATVCHEVGQ